MIEIEMDNLKAQMVVLCAIFSTMQGWLIQMMIQWLLQVIFHNGKYCQFRHRLRGRFKLFSQLQRQLIYYIKGHFKLFFHNRRSYSLELLITKISNIGQSMKTKSFGSTKQNHLISKSIFNYEIDYTIMNPSLTQYYSYVECLI